MLDADQNVPGVQNTYLIAEAVVGKSSNLPIVRPYLADAVGLVTGNRAEDFFLANATLVNPTFAEAFTEHVWLTDAIAGADADLEFGQPRRFYDGVVPYDRMMDDQPEPDQSEWMARKWMRHASRVGQERVADPNLHVLFTATNESLRNAFCRVGSNFNDLWLFVGKIGTGTLAAESLVHELAHEWRVNPVFQPGVPAVPGSLPGGHCDATFGTPQNMYHRNLKCAMHQAMHGNPNDSERSDGIIGFHYVKVGQAPDSEYLHIRRRTEPVPQNDDQRQQPQ